MRRALLERLGAIAAPALAETILERALVSAGLPDVPERTRDLDLFVTGPLRFETTRRLGEDAADALLDDLAPITRIPAALDEEITHVRSNPRASARPDAHASGVADADREPEPFGSATMRPRHARVLVVLASVDPRREQQLRVALGEHGEVIAVEDVMELLDAVQARATDEPFIVIDGVAPSVQPATLSAVAPELAHGFRLVLWAVDDAEDSDLRAVMPGASEWLRFPAEVEPVDLAIALRGFPR